MTSPCRRIENARGHEHIFKRCHLMYPRAHSTPLRQKVCSITQQQRASHHRRGKLVLSSPRSFYFPFPPTILTYSHTDTQPNMYACILYLNKCLIVFYRLVKTALRITRGISYTQLQPANSHQQQQTHIEQHRARDTYVMLTNIIVNA